MNGLRIMVVEDDAVIASLFSEVLEGMGFDVCAVEGNEADAVASAARCRPDLMIVDAQLGTGSGIKAIDEILLNGPMPHLFVTGNSLRVRALRPDAVVIQKPFFEADLARAIEHVVKTATC